MTRKQNNASTGNNTTNTNNLATLSPPSRARSRSRSPSGQKRISNGHSTGEPTQVYFDEFIMEFYIKNTFALAPGKTTINFSESSQTFNVTESTPFK